MNIASQSRRLPQTHVATRGVRRSIGFRYRGFFGVFLLAPVAAAVVFSPPSVAEDNDIALFLKAAEWVFFLAHGGVRLWEKLFTGGNKDRSLQMDGPYSLCRNPIYCGSCVTRSPPGISSKNLTRRTVIFRFRLPRLRDLGRRISHGNPVRRGLSQLL